MSPVFSLEVYFAVLIRGDGYIEQKAVAISFGITAACVFCGGEPQTRVASNLRLGTIVMGRRVRVVARKPHVHRTAMSLCLTWKLEDARPRHD